MSASIPNRRRSSAEGARAASRASPSEPQVPIFFEKGKTGTVYIFRLDLAAAGGWKKYMLSRFSGVPKMYAVPVFVKSRAPSCLSLKLARGSRGADAGVRPTA